jgi:hypothetical protein
MPVISWRSIRIPSNSSSLTIIVPGMVSSAGAFVDEGGQHLHAHPFLHGEADRAGLQTFEPTEASSSISS